MNKFSWFKVLICIMLASIISFIGFFGLIISSLAGGTKFYAPLVIVITLAIIVFVIIGVFNLLKPRVFLVVLISFFGITAVAIAGYEINKSYHESFATVNDQGVNLNEYQPFIQNTKAVSLQESSTLKLTADLPKLDGATALYPLYSAFAQAVYPEKQYNLKSKPNEVMCNNTVGSYNNLINGEADIIFAARPSKQQMEEAAQKGVELRLTPIGREAFVFFVNSSNDVNDLTTEQIQDIYSGKITNWQELGGNNEKIRAFQRPENSGSQTMLQKLMVGKDLMTPPQEDVVAGMGGIIEQTASYRNYKNAIGYSFLFFATEMVKNNQIRLLKVDSVYPDRNTIKNKEYPLSAEFYAVTAGSDNPNIEVFLEWILSSQGRYLIEQTGYTPLDS